LLSDRVGYVGPNFSSAVGATEVAPYDLIHHARGNQGMGSCGSVDPSHLLSFAPDKVC